jgi:hypothetical protein
LIIDFPLKEKSNPMIPCLPEFYFSKAETSVEKETQEQIEEGKLEFLTPFPNVAFHEYLILNLIN